MKYDHGDGMWDWQGQDYSLGNGSGSEEHKHRLSMMKPIEGHLSYAFEDEATPIKACVDFTCHEIPNDATGKEELEQCNETCSQAKRRRMLQFENEVLDAPLYNANVFLRSKETQDYLEDAIADMSQWVAGFAEDTPGSSDECLDPSSEGWIADYFNDVDLQYSTEDSASDVPDVQINVTELCTIPPVKDATVVKDPPVQARKNCFFRGKKSLMRASNKPSSSIVYPFAFIKPCGAHGDMTLKDINQRLHNPPKSKQIEEDPSASYPTSAFSGKPVVGKTKIRTEGGEGSITIMRTKG